MRCSPPSPGASRARSQSAAGPRSEAHANPIPWRAWKRSSRSCRWSSRSSSIFLVLMHSGKDSGPVRRVRRRQRHRPARRRLDGRAQPQPLDDLLRGPVLPQRDRAAQGTLGLSAAAAGHAARAPRRRGIASAAGSLGRDRERRVERLEPVEDLDRLGAQCRRRSPRSPRARACRCGSRARRRGSRGTWPRAPPRARRARGRLRASALRHRRAGRLSRPARRARRRSGALTTSDDAREQRQREDH